VSKKEISTVKLNAFRHTYVERPNNDGQNIFLYFPTSLTKWISIWSCIFRS